MTYSITVLDQEVRTMDGLFSLNDLHKASGNNRKHQPSNFLRLDTTKSLITELETENAKSSDMSIQRTAVKSMKGKNGGSFVCHELVYSYAMWISAAFYLKVIRYFHAGITHPNYRPEKTRKALPEGLTIEQQDAIKAYHKQLVSQSPKASQAKMAITLWSAIKSKFGASYKFVPSSEFVNILSLMGRVAVEHGTQALPDPNAGQMFYGLRDGRYVLYIRDGQTTIKDIAGKSIVDSSFSDTIRQNFATLSKQLKLLTGEASPTVLDLTLADLPDLQS